MERPELKLIGQDGNAFMVLGLARKAAIKAGWTKEEIEKFMDEAMSGNYDHLLQTCMENFEVS